jgi:hypothetical protein
MKMAFTPAESRIRDVRRAVHFVDFFMMKPPPVRYAATAVIVLVAALGC